MSKTPYHWPRLMKIVALKHYNRYGELIEEVYDLSNMLHIGGENFILSCMFDSSSATVPLTYYLGLDNRTTVQATDTIGSLIGEPAGYGYSRQPISSSSGWTITNFSQGISCASPVVTFTASGGTLGPISNLFLTTKLDNTGVLMATAPLSGSRTLGDGDKIITQIVLSLRNDADAGTAGNLGS